MKKCSSGMHALGLDQKQGNHFAAFAGQYVVSTARSSSVHGFYTNAVADQVLEPLRFGKAQFLSAAKQDELGTALGPWAEVAGAECLEMGRGPSRRGRIWQAAHGQGLQVPHPVDFDPGPAISVDGWGIGFVGLKFHGVAKSGRKRN